MTPTDAGIAPTTQITITGPLRPRYDEILTPEAIAFLTELHDRFAGRRHDRLADRLRRRFDIGTGRDPQFRDDTAHIREDADWKVAGAGPGLEDRRVEITGAPQPKLAINALNSGARVWLADLEDATSPTWTNVIEGQLTLFDAVRGTLEHTSASGKEYRVTAERTPTITMRPRGLHLTEQHLKFSDRAGRTMATSASLVDFGLYFFHNAQALIARGQGPYFYIPKIESAEEAKLWDDVFSFSERRLGLPHGSIRATVHIETLPAAFEMEEILFELRDHCAGLNAGRWDYVFSIIKNYRGRGARFVLPDRNEVTTSVGFLRTYTQLLVKTAHKRGAYAIGGMSAVLPYAGDPEATAALLEGVASDKRAEAEAGFDGTWVAHPGLLGIAEDAFAAVLGDRPNQLDRQRDDVEVTATQLLDLRMGRPITAQGVHDNVLTAIRYFESWLRGVGVVSHGNLVEDASLAEISRSQVWQWVHQDRSTADGTRITREYVEGIIAQVLGEAPRTEGDRFDDAATVFREVALEPDFPAFFTTGAYTKYLVETD
ncbi:malate synthase A [Microbacterium sp. No. 7]|uniref:malate synthase A n=1 Tax=Microbacterium sp. No. 7 TaxID=1714373 RepID=UPI0006D1EDF5|nr:malate synthase A [Microbacterium sp. No. 7]ALJ21318.1 malate synthase [Microbacterium sp. No. 7]